MKTTDVIGMIATATLLTIGLVQVWGNGGMPATNGDQGPARPEVSRASTDLTALGGS